MHRVSDGVRSTHGQDGAIVLDVQQGQMFNLNPVGSRILELLETGSADSDIVNVISREFNTSAEEPGSRRERCARIHGVFEEAQAGRGPLTARLLSYVRRRHEGHFRLVTVLQIMYNM